MNKKNQKPFIAFDKDGNASMHYNKSKFERENNVSRINNYLNGRNRKKINNGWTFKNYEEGDEEKYGFKYKDRE